MRHGRSVASFNFFGGVQAPVLQVFIFIGLLFIVGQLDCCRDCRGVWRFASASGRDGRWNASKGQEDQVAVETDVR